MHNAFHRSKGMNQWQVFYETDSSQAKRPNNFEMNAFGYYRTSLNKRSVLYYGNNLQQERLKFPVLKAEGFAVQQMAEERKYKQQQQALFLPKLKIKKGLPGRTRFSYDAMAKNKLATETLTLPVLKKQSRLQTKASRRPSMQNYSPRNINASPKFRIGKVMFLVVGKRVMLHKRNERQSNEPFNGVNNIRRHRASTLWGATGVHEDRLPRAETPKNSKLLADKESNTIDADSNSGMGDDAYKDEIINYSPNPLVFYTHITPAPDLLSSYSLAHSRSPGITITLPRASNLPCTEGGLQFDCFDADTYKQTAYQVCCDTPVVGDMRRLTVVDFPGELWKLSRRRSTETSVPMSSRAASPSINLEMACRTPDLSPLPGPPIAFLFPGQGNKV